ncbi:MAG: signal peptide peptidase SppA [Bacteroidales bacterium]|nr:signal peptide peptidase SppA [Bacteroidales bacterium]MDD4031249.1 signal peptide peptidase SppA [Bacteroidales bacterium]MDD4435690.1 signal peptide peptidase SppA [Bacteroidales bacterium]
MKDFLKTLAAVILGSALVLITGFFLLVGSLTSIISLGLAGTAPAIPQNAILHITFEEGVSTQDSDLPTLGFLPPELNIRQGGTGFLGIAQAIEQAAADPYIRMIFLDPQYLNAQMSHIEEIRNALISFRQSGKPVISYAPAYSQQAYYLASAADKVIINPEGNIILQGFSASVNYYKELFDRLGVEAQVIRHGSYKTGGEPFTASRMSDQERKQLTTYLATAWEHWSAGMEQARHMEQGAIDRLCMQSFLTDAGYAKETGLADEVWHQDEVIAYLSSVYEGLPEKRLPFVSLRDYISHLEMNRQKPVREKIAVVYAIGDITVGKGTGQVFANTYAAQLRQYRNDTTVKAIVLRIESPGGDPMAAGIITREIQLTAMVKPVIASLGDVAASGGYWIASAASKILVQPSGMTGSIGVYSILFNGEKTLSDILDIRNETVDTHPYSHFNSLYHSKSEKELQIVREQVESVYCRFVETVANNRHMDRQVVENLADGRIWSGKEAISNGLADQQGGLTDAIRVAAGMAGLTGYRLVTFPKPFRIIDLIHMPAGKKSVGVESLIEKQLLDLLGKGGIRARLPFDEKSLSW